jgi:hypothetical protein
LALPFKSITEKRGDDAGGLINEKNSSEPPAIKIAHGHNPLAKEKS